MTKKVDCWWTGMKSIFAEEDGQECRNTYSRKVKNKWEYVLVITEDDGTLIQSVSFKNGKAETTHYE